MTWLRLLLLSLCFSAAAHATSYNGTLLKLVTCDKAEYAPNATATCTLAITNTTGSSFTGTADVLVWKRSAQVGSTQTVTITALANNASTAPTVSIVLPNIPDPRGYLVTVRVKNTVPTVVDSGSGFLESTNAGYLSFPRPGFIGNAFANSNATAQVNSWLAWGVNLPIYYDLYNTAHTPAPPAAAPSWTNLENQIITRSVVNNFITAAHNANMGIGVFEDWNAASDNWSTDGTGLSPTWALYGVPCKTPTHLAACTYWTGSNTTADQLAIGDRPPDWKSFGWKTNNQPMFDPSDGAYVNFNIVQMRAMFTQFAFDFWWIDTIGDIGADVYRANGTQINAGSGLGPSLADFVNAAIPGTGHPAIINNVDRWADIDIGSRAAEPFIFSEIWSSVTGQANGTPFYTDINGGVSRYRQVSAKPIVFPAYINVLYRHTPACLGLGITTPCSMNEPAARYLTSQIMASGAYHATFVDTDTMGSAPYFVEQQLGMTASLMAAELDLQHFGIGYENLLRDGVNDSLQPCSVSGGPTGSSVGAGNAVWTLPKQKGGFAICHLINHSTVPDIHWSDENNTAVAPTVYTNFTAKVYYFGTLSKVWIASPEIAHGEPNVVSSTPGSDGGGTFVTFTVPSLTYWDMLVVETTAVTGTDFDIDPTLGLHASQLSHSYGPMNTTSDLLTSSPGSIAEYDGLLFAGALAHMSFSYAAAYDTRMEVRVDSRDGPLLANIALPSTGGVGSFSFPTVSITPASAIRHKLFIVFPGRPVGLGFFSFAA